jgi:hypothetical protein
MARHKLGRRLLAVSAGQTEQKYEWEGPYLVH